MSIDHLINKTQKKTKKAQITKKCSKCSMIKEITNFSYRKDRKIGVISRCRSCIAMVNTIKYNTYDGFCRKMLKDSKENNKKRNKKIKNNRNLEHTIQISDVFRLPKKCYYTNTPMTFAPHSDFGASLERLDNTKGYIPGNVVLCCGELNGPKQVTKDKISKLFSGKISNPVEFNSSDFEQQPYIKFSPNVSKTCNSDREESPIRGCKSHLHLTFS
jgi:hypothetical protein